ncbi:MAG: endonuclease [Bacilli bacterium]
MTKTRFQTKTLYLGVLSVALLMAFGSFLGRNTVPAEAGPRPTNINTAHLDDEGLVSYYETVSGTKGDALLAALNQVIDDHQEYDYDSSSDRYIYKIIDRNWTLSPMTAPQLAAFDYAGDNPYIHKLYADYNDDVATADLFKNTGASRVSFDKEHIWAQSLGNFGRSTGAGSDFHALWPSDILGNQNAHSNYNFATPTSEITNYNNDKGTYVGRNGYIAGSSSKVFEPLDQYKGDIARAMFYMPARYYEYVDTYHPKLTLVNGSPGAVTASPTQAGLAGDLETLLAWNELDPVDEYEIHRNNLIYNNYQGNRNPFIDFPEWATIAYDPDYAGGGVSFGDEPIDPPVVTLTGLSAAWADPNKKYYVGDAIAKADFVVTATYSDASQVIVSDYELTLSGQSGLTFSTVGPHTVNFSYSEGALVETATLNVAVLEVPVPPKNYTVVIVISSVSLVAVGVLVPIIIKTIRRRAMKSIKRML